jgi:hypothetical protein
VFHVIGLDLGESNDHSAVTVLEVEPKQHLIVRPGHDAEYGRAADIGSVIEGLPLTYRCRHLERLPLHTPYPEVVEHVGKLLGRFRDRPMLAVDATGVGRGVVVMLEFAGLEPTPITITGGLTVTLLNGFLHVPKRELVFALLTAVQENRFHVAKGLSAAGALLHELESFRVKITKAANERFESATESDHDDLVMAIAIAAWLAEYVVNASLVDEHVPAGEPVSINGY